MTDKKKNSLHSFLYALIIFAVIIAIYFTISIYTRQIETENMYQSMKTSQQNFTRSEQQLLASESSLIITDTIFIRDLIENNYLNQAQNKKALIQLEDNLSSFIVNKQIYDQIRYLDENGNELIRVDLQDNKATTYHGADLQNKADRYYFTDTINTDYGQVYFSKFDLNVERGKIEIPVKPTLRIATKVKDSLGNIKGIVIANYFGKNLLNDFENLAVNNEGNTYLLNADSYYLRNMKDPSGEFAFMYEDKKEINFKQIYPDVWEKILENPTNIYKDKDNIFISTDVIPITSGERSSFAIPTDTLVLGGGNWFVVSHLTKAEHPELFNATLTENIIAIIQNNPFLIAIIFLLSYALGTYLHHKHAQLKQERFHSEFDSMTLAYNKRAGMEKIKGLIKTSRGTENLICLCFLDVNGLKTVNDTLGHEHGDALIKKSADLIISTVRNFDFLIRYGGDEFILVLYKLNREQADGVWQRIQTKFNEENDTSDRPYNISISHGFSFIESSEVNVDLDAHIKEADENMYEEKKEVKKTVTILR